MALFFYALKPDGPAPEPEFGSTYCLAQSTSQTTCVAPDVPEDRWTRVEK